MARASGTGKERRSSWVWCLAHANARGGTCSHPAIIERAVSLLHYVVEARVWDGRRCGRRARSCDGRGGSGKIGSKQRPARCRWILQNKIDITWKMLSWFENHFLVRKIIVRQNFPFGTLKQLPRGASSESDHGGRASCKKHRYKIQYHKAAKSRIIVKLAF